MKLYLFILLTFMIRAEERTLTELKDVIKNTFHDEME